MLIYLYGPDTYRRYQKIKEIVTKFQEKNPHSKAERFYLKEKKEKERFLTFIENQGLFSSIKCAVVEDFEKAELADVLKNIKDDLATTLILLSEKKLTTGFSFLHKSPVLSQTFAALKGLEIKQFIQKELKDRNLKLSGSALHDLSSAYGSDTWGLITELDKLALGGVFEKKLNRPDFFPAVQTIKGRGSLNDRLKALGYLLENEEPAAVFNVTAALADKELKEKMADFDIAIKSGKLEYEEALTELVLSR